MGKRIILLNGPSSSGKSTLAKTLQKRIAETRNKQYAVISIDDFLPMTAEEPIYEDDVFAISLLLCEAAQRTVLKNDGVIIDHVITSRRIFEQLRQMLQEYDLRLVRVTCPLEVLRKREQERKNRCLGSAEASQKYLFPQDGYDVTVDTHANTALECADRILEEILETEKRKSL